MTQRIRVLSLVLSLVDRPQESPSPLADSLPLWGQVADDGLH